MVPAIKNYLANQARKPSGWFGRIVSPLVFNHENSEMEDYGLRLMNPKRMTKSWRLVSVMGVYYPISCHILKPEKSLV